LLTLGDSRGELLSSYLLPQTLLSIWGGLAISVPAQKCSNFSKYNQFLNSCQFDVYNSWKVRVYSTSSLKDKDESSDDQFIPAAIYEDASSMQKAILKDNAGKAGIYMLTNKLTGDIYVGQSIDLRKRFLNYFNLSYLNRRNELIICRAIIKYSKFSVTILEYCDKCDILRRWATLFWYS